MSNTTTTAHLQVLLGAGGVGKTTMTVVLGLQAARRGERVAILTIDPARRLASALGLDSDHLGNEPTCVARLGRGELWAAMLDPTAMFSAIIDSAVADPAQRARIHYNRLFQSLTENLSGTHEYMAVEALSMLASDGRFDRVIVDTPPARQAIDFLESPQRLVRFLDHPLYRRVLAPKSGMARIGARVAQRVVGGLGSVVGGGIVNDIIDLFAALEGLDDGFRRRAIDVQRLLHSPRTRYAIVTSGRAEACSQASWLAAGLAERSLPVDLLIANRLTPGLVGYEPDGGLPAALQQNLAELSVLARSEADLVAALVAETTPGEVLEIRDRAEPPSTLEELEALL